MLFPIGMFPYIMIVTALIFFSADFHQSIIRTTECLVVLTRYVFTAATVLTSTRLGCKKYVLGFLAIFFVVQLLFPFRYLLYPGELFWTEEGLPVFVAGDADGKSGICAVHGERRLGPPDHCEQYEFLTPLQEKMMATQPDMMLQYAHILRDYYAGQGFQHPEVYVDSYVALNGRLGRPLINPDYQSGQ